MPRSGTTLLDRMLSGSFPGGVGRRDHRLLAPAALVGGRASSQVAGAAEDHRNAARDIDYAELGARYLRQTQWRAQGRAFYIDKLPANIQMVAFIRRALPHAPILHMVRDPIDTCFSNFKAMFGNVSPYSYDLHALAHYYGQYARLARHWHDRLARRHARCFLRCAGARPGEHARPGVRSTVGWRRRRAACDPELNASPVATPSSAQVREAIHTRGLGGWRHYAKQLEPLRQALAGQPRSL